MSGVFGNPEKPGEIQVISGNNGAFGQNILSKLGKCINLRKKKIISYFSITRWDIGEKRQAKAIKVYSQPGFTRGNRGPEEKHRRNDSARLRLGKAGREGSQSLLGRVAWAIPRPDFGRRHYSHVESLHGGAISVRYPMNYDELITWFMMMAISQWVKLDVGNALQQLISPPSTADISRLRSHLLIYDRNSTTCCWFGTMEFYDFSIHWECHHPNWLIFFGGVGIPPTRLTWFIGDCELTHYGNPVLSTRGWHFSFWTLRDGDRPNKRMFNMVLTSIIWSFNIA